MKKKVIIHIGHLKSGSSSIQNFIYDNNAKLTSGGKRLRYVQSAIAIERFIGIRHLFLNKVDLESGGRWPDVVDEISACEEEVAIVSYEGLIRYSKNEVELVGGLLEKFEVTVVVYLRRQDFFIQSLYVEYLQNHSFKCDFSSFATAYEHLCDYRHIVSLWSDVFGSEKIIVRNFDHIVSQAGDVVVDFCSLFNISIPEDVDLSIYRENRSLKKEMLEVVFALNRVDIPLKQKRLFCQEYLRRCRGFSFNKQSFFSNDSAQRFLENYHEDNHWLLESYPETFDASFSGVIDYPACGYEIEFNANLKAVFESFFSMSEWK